MAEHEDTYTKFGGNRRHAEHEHGIDTQRKQRLYTRSYQLLLFESLYYVVDAPTAWNRRVRWGNHWVALIRTSRLRCSMNTCKLTSSVKIACPEPAFEPYTPPDTCVVDGLSFDNRNRA